MTEVTSEIDKKIMHLCEVMGIEKEQIRYVLVKGVEFIGEVMQLPEEDPFNGDLIDLTETTFFHPMRINVEIDVSPEGHLCSEKWFSPLNPYSEHPYIPFKNYDIVSQTRIFPDLMLDYLTAVYDSYFSLEAKDEETSIESSVQTNNVYYIQDYRRKR